MGFWDFMFGGFRAPREEEPNEDYAEKKAYGDLYSGGRGRVEPEEIEEAEEEKPTANEIQRARDLRRMNNDLAEVERRARDLQIYEKPLREKVVGKLTRDLGRIERADNPRILSQANQKTRRDLRRGYAKTEKAFNDRVERLKKEGASDRRIKEEEIKMKKIRDDMSEMYRRAGGSGMLK